ncbi:MAG: hypothetical protein KDB14_18860 [Planctomycetales bacterium]|nr:hypothetical protein [Planctomycetales bacterium]
MKLRIIKVGGSLFDLADLPERLGAWLKQQAPGVNLLVPGGGALADCVRRYDATFAMDEAYVHGVAVATMRLLASILSRVCELPLVDEPPTIGPATVVLDVRRLMLREPAAPGLALRATWDVTSDSICARLTQLLAADELWLLKSVTPAAAGLEQLVQEGIVDPEFPHYIAESSATWQVINLREPTWRDHRAGP